MTALQYILVGCAIYIILEVIAAQTYCAEMIRKYEKDEIIISDGFAMDQVFINRLYAKDRIAEDFSAEISHSIPPFSGSSLCGALFPVTTPVISNGGITQKKPHFEFED